MTTATEGRSHGARESSCDRRLPAGPVAGWSRRQGGVQEDGLLDELKKASAEPTLNVERPLHGDWEGGRFFKQTQWVRQVTILAELSKNMLKVPRHKLPTLLTVLYLVRCPSEALS